MSLHSISRKISVSVYFSKPTQFYQSRIPPICLYSQSPSHQQFFFPVQNPSYLPFSISYQTCTITIHHPMRLWAIHNSRWHVFCYCSSLKSTVQPTNYVLFYHLDTVVLKNNIILIMVRDHSLKNNECMWEDTNAKSMICIRTTQSDSAANVAQ